MDIYNWILSEEIREHLRANHSLSIDEKILIIHSAYRSLEEKYAALQTLLEEADNQEDKDVLSQMCRLYDWIFEQMYSEMPGQVFLYALPVHCHIGVTVPEYHVAGVFHTYDELMGFLENETRYRIDTATTPCRIENPNAPYELEEAKYISESFRIEKWAYIDGKMEGVVLFDAFTICGHCCFRDFLIKCGGYGRFEESVGRMGISERVVKLFNCDIEKNPLPLPFQFGDLVCLDLPCWYGELYGVVKVDAVLINGCRIEKYINMYYYTDRAEDSCLMPISIDGWDIDATLNLPVVQWLRHAEPSELPDDQKPLAELSFGLRRLAERDREAAEGTGIGIDYVVDKSVQDIINEINLILKEDAAL